MRRSWCASRDAAKATMLQPVLKRLADAHIPHLLFVNKFDKARGPLRTLLAALQRRAKRRSCCARYRSGSMVVAHGFVDLALERAYHYRPHAPAKWTDIADYAREKEARLPDAGKAGGTMTNI
jgi:elongation factor G